MVIIIVIGSSGDSCNPARWQNLFASAVIACGSTGTDAGMRGHLQCAQEGITKQSLSKPVSLVTGIDGEPADSHQRNRLWHLPPQPAGRGCAGDRAGCATSRRSSTPEATWTQRRAVEALTKATALAPRHAQAFEHVSLALRAAGQMEVARAAADGACALERRVCSTTGGRP